MLQKLLDRKSLSLPLIQISTPMETNIIENVATPINHNQITETKEKDIATNPYIDNYTSIQLESQGSKNNNPYLDTVENCKSFLTETKNDNPYIDNFKSPTNNNIIMGAGDDSETSREIDYIGMLNLTTKAHSQTSNSTNMEVDNKLSLKIEDSKKSKLLISVIM